jgi:hypothetical protein
MSYSQKPLSEPPIQIDDFLKEQYSDALREMMPGSPDGAIEIFLWMLRQAYIQGYQSGQLASGVNTGSLRIECRERPTGH